MQDPLATLTPRARTAVIDHLAALRHDLGKYVSFQARWLGDDPPVEALREALEADLLATRRGPSGTVDAGDIWDGLAPEIRGERPLSTGDTVDLRGDPDFDRLEAQMGEVRRAIGALRAGAADEAALRSGAEAARAVAELCRGLWQRARTAAGGV